MEKIDEVKMKAVKEIAPLRQALNDKIKDIVIDRGIDLNVYIYGRDELCGKAPIIGIDVFLRGE